MFLELWLATVSFTEDVRLDLYSSVSTVKRFLGLDQATTFILSRLKVGTQVIHFISDRVAFSSLVYCLFYDTTGIGIPRLVLVCRLNLAGIVSLPCLHNHEPCPTAILSCINNFLD